MHWKITAYNGTTWEADTSMYPEEAITTFINQTGLTYWDIKIIENLH